MYRSARHEAWQDVNGSAVPFDGDAFQRDALRWKRAPERAVMCAMQRDDGRPAPDGSGPGADDGVGYIPFLYMSPPTGARAWGAAPGPGGIHLPASGTGPPAAVLRAGQRDCPALLPEVRLCQGGGGAGARGPLDVLEKYIGFEAKES
ncbi:MAG: hypothetical protein ACLRIS_07780 [Flavonifractor plautii]